LKYLQHLSLPKFYQKQFPNPFLLASCPITRTGEMCERGFKAGWGGAVLKV